MREHGVLRRALLVYIETVPKLRANAGNVPRRSDRPNCQTVPQLR